MSRAGAGWVALVLMVSGPLTGCRGDHPDPGSVTAMTVTGTDGKAADPAEATPTENQGRFSVSYNIEIGPGVAVELLARAPNSGEEVTLGTNCCNYSAACTPATFSCQYLAGGTVNCGDNPVLLTDFFVRNGGLPNQAQLVIKATTNSCALFPPLGGDGTPRQFTAERGFVFR